ncbi:hypothetical protein [Planotetraspora kaengkrachanensis]|uniref:Uncharacterized protein n=1 Tax=Planotetraspora kaengkrachanensis TaxID=575193 RepID=A0A8J3V6Z6_9ACTN|nr:hypothetical protein [Planotetraspora kaengkrachanensis]GIG81432.1 hypothetical protein Pka01_45590 [Planotetraspora kaengkrachanensis]
MRVFVETDAGTTGEVRLVEAISGAQLGSTLSGPAADNCESLEASVLGDYLTLVVNDVHVRRMAPAWGTTAIRMGVAFAEGIQS